MSRKIISVISLMVERPFEELVKIFHSKGADLRRFEFNIKPLFRIFNEDDPKKVICIKQPLQGSIQEFVEANSKWINIQKVDLSTIEKSYWK